MSIHMRHELGRSLRKCGYGITREYRWPEIHVRRTETYQIETNGYWWIEMFQDAFGIKRVLGPTMIGPGRPQAFGAPGPPPPWTGSAVASGRALPN
jgi:hypothetical protein